MAQMFPSIGERKPNMQVFTIEDCSSCGTKTKRAFKLGDFVYKDGGECQKCRSRTLITMIYAEQIQLK
jgi:DNA-directed RNA polymerase subunit RPC12/RpoP